MLLLSYSPYTMQLTGVFLVGKLWKARQLQTMGLGLAM